MAEKAVQQQPMGTPMMAVNGGNRNALNKPIKSNGQREWSHGVFDCFGACGTCFFSWCCPCFQYGKNSSRLKHLNSQGAPHPSGGDCCNSDCMTYGALVYCGCPCLVHMGMRKDIRGRYNIEGGGGNDFLCTWCCIPCVLTQESRELELEEKSLIGH
ncbi:PLAC8-domain-containing protein [Clavulina sp. PMI_390]|nr:PLAC8-domain-containing protein [Clavulina sp. PMI_390]